MQEAPRNVTQQYARYAQVPNCTVQTVHGADDKDRTLRTTPNRQPRARWQLQWIVEMHTRAEGAAQASPRRDNGEIVDNRCEAQ